MINNICIERTINIESATLLFVESRNFANSSTRVKPATNQTVQCVSIVDYLHDKIDRNVVP